MEAFSKKIKKPGALPTSFNKLYHKWGVLVSERTRFLDVDLDDMTVQHAIEPGKVVLLILDGHQGKAKAIEAVHHGHTIIETAKGKTARIRFEESELF